MSHRFVTGALAALFVLSPLHPVEAAARGQTAQGWAYLQGGIGRDEVEMLSAARPFYSLSIRTAAGGRCRGSLRRSIPSSRTCGPTRR